MTEAEWEVSGDPEAMLSWTTSKGAFHAAERWPVVSDRKLRLFACACVRQAWHLLTDDRSRRAVEVAERYADGEATRAELDDASHVVYDAEIQHAPAPLHGHLAWVAVDYNVGARLSGVFANWADLACAAESFPRLAALLRDLVGNPWRPVTLPPGPACEACGGTGLLGTLAGKLACYTCGTHPDRPGTGRLPSPVLTPRVVSLAHAAYAERRPDGTLDPDRLAVLSDALEEAGLEGERCPAECEGGWLVRNNGGAFRCGVCHGTGRIPHPLLAHLRQTKEEYLTSHNFSAGDCRECGMTYAEHMARKYPEDRCIRRRTLPHYRGMWSLDLILGKE